MDNVQDFLQRHLGNVKAKVTQAMSDYGRNASGASVGSLTVEVNGNIGTLYGSKSFLAMEYGKKPGKVPYNFKDIIRQWIINKGIAVTPIPSKKRDTKYTPYERGLNSMAGAIAYKIMKEGTKLHRDNGYNDIYTSAVREELKLMSEELVLYTADSIAKINKSL
jgi:hypothetical protein